MGALSTCTVSRRFQTKTVIILTGKSSIPCILQAGFVQIARRPRSCIRRPASQTLCFLAIPRRIVRGMAIAKAGIHRLIRGSKNAFWKGADAVELTMGIPAMLLLGLLTLGLMFVFVVACDKV